MSRLVTVRKMDAATVRPLTDAIAPTKQAARRHYGSHPYFTKRAWNVVQAYIKNFSSPGDTVLDPFGGSGVTAVESLVLRRKAVYVDVSAWATFLARQTALAPADIEGLGTAYSLLERRCLPYLTEIASLTEEQLAQLPVRDWYPKGVKLPSNADVQFVEDLFTPRMMHGLAHLRAGIMECDDLQVRDLLRLAFSSTLVRINRTFLSAKDRLESRGGSSIFSLYRYKIAQLPVELPLWDQFTVRFKKLLDAKCETNQLINDFYREGDTAVFRYGSATRLLDFLKPHSVDYIYTDPPYGGHISYLDLSTMWAAWLGFEITEADRTQEAIEGGELRKDRNAYEALIAESLIQMHDVLKPGAWMSVVFVHRDTTYWEVLVDACAKAGMQYVNTVVQPVGVVWSMHKKKNPLRVLSGELVLNFRKPSRTVVAMKRQTNGVDPLRVVRQTCEAEIVHRAGATTDELHHAVIPKLLETGLLSEFSKQHGDLVELLKRYFVFADTGKWHLCGVDLVGNFTNSELGRYHITRMLTERYLAGKPPAEKEVRKLVLHNLKGRGALADKTIHRLLRETGTCPDGQHWLPQLNGDQRLLF